jgi:hypothetical protein
MEYRNAKYTEFGKISCEINHPTLGWIPFTCNPDDKGTFFDTKKLFDTMAKDQKTKPYIPPSKKELTAVKANETRELRDIYLRTVVDPIVTNPFRWAELTEEDKEKYTTYRRQLLDITKQDGFPESVTWPVLK